METLPIELLIKIFAHGSASDAQLARSPPSIYVPFPLLISHVCCHWRSIALSNPRLWTTIISTKDVPYFPILRLQVERAGPHPLDVYLNFDYPQPWTDPESYLPPTRKTPRDPGTADWIVDEEYGSSFWLLDSDNVRLRLGLLTVSRNIRTYHLSADLYEYIVMALRLFPLAFIAESSMAESRESARVLELEDVRIQYNKESEDNPRRWGTVFLPVDDGLAPKLTSLSLRGLGLDLGSGTRSTATSVTGLTTLELRDLRDKAWFSVRQLRSTLSTNPSLETLVLENAIPTAKTEERNWEWTWPLDEPTTLSSLQKFVLVRESAQTAERLLQRMHFPSIKNLQIDLPLLGDETGDDTHDALIRIHVPLIPSLEILRLEELHGSSTVARSLLAALPVLRVLALNFNIHPNRRRFIPLSFGQCLLNRLVEMEKRERRQSCKQPCMPELEVLLLCGVEMEVAHRMLPSRPVLRRLRVYVGTRAMSPESVPVQSCEVVDEDTTKDVGLYAGNSEKKTSANEGGAPIEFRECEWRAWTPVDGICGQSKLDLFNLEAFLRRIQDS